MFKNIASCITALALTTAPVMAATFNFGTMNLDSNNSLTVDGITVTAKAGVYSDKPLGGPDADEIVFLDCSETILCNKAVDQNDDGLGIKNGSLTNQIDGIFADELLSLHFDHEVLLTLVDFKKFGSNDSFDFFVDGVLYPPEERTDDPFQPNPAIKGTIFSFGADAINDKFRLKRAKVEKMAPIPLPAAGWMLLAGLGGLAAMRRRKKS